MIEDTYSNCKLNKKNCLIVPEFNMHKNPNDKTLPLLAFYIQNLNKNKSVINQLEPLNWHKTAKKNFKQKKRNFSK